MNNLLVTEIRLEILKNLGNYESVRYSVCCACNGVVDFEPLKKEIESQHNKLYLDVKKGKKELIYAENKDSEFQKVLSSYKSGRVSLEKIKEFYILSKEVEQQIKQL